MPKGSLLAAEQRSDARLLAGRDDHPHAKFCDDELQYYVDLVENDDISSESTFAIARMGNTIYYAKQGAVQQKHLPTANLFKDVQNVVDCTVKGKIDDLTISGIHAEMMIIRYLVVVLGNNKNNLGALELEIASTKGCCLDCAGWLTLHGIPHSKTNGKPSMMWRHPITLSLYRHDNTKPDTGVKFYQAVGPQQGHQAMNVRAGTNLTHK